MKSLRMLALLSAGLLFLVALALYAQDEPADQPPAETPKEAPAEPPAETPKETPAEPPKETPKEAPAEPPAETPKETPAEPPKEAPAETPKDQPGETPRSPGGTIPLPRAALLKENTRLIDVEGLVLDLKDDLKASPVSRAVFQPKDGLGYFIILENALLEKVLAETSHGERPVKVRGTISLFRGRNFLQLDYAAVKQE